MNCGKFKSLDRKDEKISKGFSRNMNPCRGRLTSQGIGNTVNLPISAQKGFIEKIKLQSKSFGETGIELAMKF